MTCKITFNFSVFYREKSKVSLDIIQETFHGIDYAVHKSEGAFFLWIWFRDLPVTTKELYNRLKERDVLVIPGEYFFYGLEEPWEHQDQCIRLNFAQPEDVVRKGIAIIAEEVQNSKRVSTI